MMLNMLAGQQYRFTHSLDTDPDPDSFELHTHLHYELLIFLSGKVTYLVEGNSYTPKPYDMLLYNIAETHKAVVDPSVPYERMVLYLDKDLLSWVEGRERLFHPFTSRQLGENNLISPEAFFGSLWKDCLQRLERAGEDPLEITANLLPFLNEVAKAARNSRYVYQRDQLSMQIVSYVNENIASPLTVNEIAEHFHISRSFLYALFRQTTGANPHDYIRTKRLVLARRLIMDGTAPNSACLQCGFTDYTTFFRGYKARFGTTPKEDMPK